MKDRVASFVLTPRGQYEPFTISEEEVLPCAYWLATTCGFDPSISLDVLEEKIRAGTAHILGARILVRPSPAAPPHNHHKYHVECVLAEIHALLKRKDGDTRIRLSLDAGEASLVRTLLESELAAIERTLENKP